MKTTKHQPDNHLIMILLNEYDMKLLSLASFTVIDRIQYGYVVYFIHIQVMLTSIVKFIKRIKHNFFYLNPII